MEQLYQRTYPFIFAAWAVRMKIDVPNNMVKAIEDIGVQVMDWKTLYDSTNEKLAQAEHDIIQLKLDLDEKRARSTEQRASLDTNSPDLTSDNDDKINSKKFTTYQRIVHAWGHKLKFDPDKNNGATSTIATATQLAGAPADKKAIREALRQSHDACSKKT